jgi:acyl-CoA synthetase (AMP-forming)/AMP-acid ligase II
MSNHRQDGTGNFAACLQRHAEEMPNALAYRFLLDGGDKEALISYGELDQRARTLAATLQRSCRPGERVLLLLTPGFDYITGFFGCLYAGLVAVPAYPPSTSKILDRLDSIIRDCQPAAALANPEHLAAVHDRLQSLAPGARVLAIGDCDPALAAAWQRPAIGADDLAFLQYTSGSTGDPKGVMISHRNLTHNSAMIQRSFAVQRDGHIVSWLPPYHDMGLIGGILQSAYTGCSTTLMTPIHFLQRPIRWLRAVSKYRGTVSGGPNFAFELCVNKVKDEELEGLDLSHWHVAFNGAENVRASTIAAFEARFAACGFRRASSFPCYGLAESTLMVTASVAHQGAVTRPFDVQQLEDNHAQPVETADDGRGRALVSSGRLLAGEAPFILDPESDRELPPGQVGEICAASDSVAAGYWQRPEASARVFIDDPLRGRYFRTGDLGFVLDDQLYVTGRLKDLIVVNGVNHHPGDIEATVYRQQEGFRPDGSAAFCMEIDGVERVAIAQEVERRALRELDTERLFESIRSGLWQGHRLAQPVILLMQGGSLPRTSSGKIKRQECRKQLTTLVELLRRGTVAGETNLENRVIAIEFAGKSLELSADSEPVAV